MPLHVFLYDHMADALTRAASETVEHLTDDLAEDVGEAVIEYLYEADLLRLVYGGDAYIDACREVRRVALTALVSHMRRQRRVSDIDGVSDFFASEFHGQYDHPERMNLPYLAGATVQGVGTQKERRMMPFGDTLQTFFSRTQYLPSPETLRVLGRLLDEDQEALLEDLAVAVLAAIRTDISPIAGISGALRRAFADYSDEEDEVVLDCLGPFEAVAYSFGFNAATQTRIDYETVARYLVHTFRGDIYERASRRLLAEEG